MIDPSWPAKERAKLMTHGDGIPPYAGYIWDENELFWYAPPGVEDVNARRHDAETPYGIKLHDVKITNLLPENDKILHSRVFLTLNTTGEIVAAYWTEARAQRDVDLVSRASGHVLTIKAVEIEA